MRDSVARPVEIQSAVSPARASRRLPPDTDHIAEWLELQQGYLARYWLAEIMHRVTLSEEEEHLLGRFLELLTAMIPRSLGQHRVAVCGLWKRAAELFGALGARRGLAAGEVVEEFQIVREAVIRLLFQVPASRQGATVSLSDSVRLSRFIDSGVTHASIGHTDGLFFSMFQGSGVPKVPPAQLMLEVEEQLLAIDQELRVEIH